MPILQRQEKFVTPQEESPVAESLNPDEVVSFNELLISNMIEIQAIAQLLMGGSSASRNITPN